MSSDTTAVSRPAWREWRGYAPLDASFRLRFASAAGDVMEGRRRWRLWTFLALDEIRNAYRRTVVGPWWLTLQTSIHIAGLSLLFGAVFHRPLHQFLPYVGIGYIVFALLAGLARHGLDVFVSNSSSIVSNRQPLSVLVFRGVTVELLQFAHNVVIIVVFGALGLLSLGPEALLVIPATALIAVNGLAIGLWLGPAVARFRDVGPIVGSVIQMLAFFTPIFWFVDSVKGQQRIAILVWNPFYYFLQSFRSPLLGLDATKAFVGVIAITVVNIAIGMLVFTKTRSRIPYWVS